LPRAANASRILRGWLRLSLRRWRLSLCDALLWRFRQTADPSTALRYGRNDESECGGIPCTETWGPASEELDESARIYAEALAEAADLLDGEGALSIEKHRDSRFRTELRYQVALLQTIAFEQEANYVLWGR
jgi:hypothetical protein